jgi:hypothetical protein
MPDGPLRVGWAGDIEGANTFLAHGIGGDVECTAKGEGLRTVDDFMQEAVVEIAQRAVEKARADCAVGLDDS